MNRPAYSRIFPHVPTCFSGRSTLRRSTLPLTWLSASIRSYPWFNLRLAFCTKTAPLLHQTPRSTVHAPTLHAQTPLIWLSVFITPHPWLRCLFQLAFYCSEDQRLNRPAQNFTH